MAIAVDHFLLARKTNFIFFKVLSQDVFNERKKKLGGRSPSEDEGSCSADMNKISKAMLDDHEVECARRLADTAPLILPTTTLTAKPRCCSICHQPGHTKRTCTMVGGASHPAALPSAVGAPVAGATQGSTLPLRPELSPALVHSSCGASSASLKPTVLTYTASDLAVQQAMELMTLMGQKRSAAVAAFPHASSPRFPLASNCHLPQVLHPPQPREAGALLTGKRAQAEHMASQPKGKVRSPFRNVF